MADPGIMPVPQMEEAETIQPVTPEEQALLDRVAACARNKDLQGSLDMLTELEMSFQREIIQRYLGIAKWRNISGEIINSTWWCSFIGGVCLAFLAGQVAALAIAVAMRPFVSMAQFAFSVKIKDSAITTISAILSNMIVGGTGAGLSGTPEDWATAFASVAASGFGKTVEGIIAFIGIAYSGTLSALRVSFSQKALHSVLTPVANYDYSQHVVSWDLYRASTISTLKGAVLAETRLRYEIAVYWRATSAIFMIRFQAMQAMRRLAEAPR
ncbi:MAG: hypothetical protein HY820_35890 [Acidobacteria bacterium]|nr:hypothetical protein [Acidobacteriota bacterium]